MERDINDVLVFREDISPFLIHLTKPNKLGISAKQVLERIIGNKRLIAGGEPILDFDVGELLLMIHDIKPKFVAIGADSKGHMLEEPSSRKIGDLIKELRKITEVKLKSNLNRLYNV